MWKLLASLLLLSLTATLAALGPVPPEKDTRPLPLENDALALALADVKGALETGQIDAWDTRFLRWVWIEDGDPNGFRVISDDLNDVSQNPRILRAVPIVRDRLVLVRVNLKPYAPKAADLKDLLATWEEFRFDPRFNLLLTRDGLGLKKAKAKTVAKKGKAKKKKAVEEEDQEDVARFPADGHVDQALLNELKALTQSEAPVVSSGYFHARISTQIQDKGVFKTLYGGLYYRAAGIKKAKAGQGTDEDLLFETEIGLGNAKAGITAAQIYERLESDQRVAVFYRDLNGKPSRIDFAHGPQSRNSGGKWSVTHDIRDQDVDIGTHPVYNLLDFQDFAREMIWERKSGKHGYALFNNKGALQDEVPPDVAINREVPSPRPMRLQPKHGCKQCHEAKRKLDGWQDLRNDVKTLFAGFTDLLGDRSKKNPFSNQVRERLAGLYTGSPADWLRTGRNDFARATLLSTGPFLKPDGTPVSEEANADIVYLAAKKGNAMFADHVYELVTPQRAVRDWTGIELEPAAALKRINELLPPDPDSQIGDGTILENPTLAGLKVGIGVNRIEYALAYSFGAARAHRVMAGEQKK